MASSTKPALVFVTGSFVMATHYEFLMEAIKTKGYPAQVIQLKTAGTRRPGPLPTMYDDAADINAAAAKFADEGRDVVVVAHSYGGVPATQSLKGVTKAEREKEGKQGGVVRLAYMTALAPELGAPAGSLFFEGSGARPDLMAPGEDGWLYHTNLELSREVCFNSLTVEKGKEVAEEFVNHSSLAFVNELTHAGYKDVPVSYLFCEDDKCVTPPIQQRVIDTIESASGRKVDITRNFSDHCPEISTPDNVINWLAGLLEKGGKE
ncbi:unnamed protein product [Periconia digitata]|uniref:AB hydrolase-1 domain-containing protein n=1 Tax=Periconia digitata TaxID=1303443 RepID=A0A9W4XML0_9PLEO|nr:unnamed protein product [Periconia digitata]